MESLPPCGLLSNRDQSLLVPEHPLVGTDGRASVSSRRFGIIRTWPNAIAVRRRVIQRHPVQRATAWPTQAVAPRVVATAGRLDSMPRKTVGPVFRARSVRPRSAAVAWRRSVLHAPVA